MEYICMCVYVVIHVQKNAQHICIANIQMENQNVTGTPTLHLLPTQPPPITILPFMRIISLLLFMVALLYNFPQTTESQARCVWPQ